MSKIIICPHTNQVHNGSYPEKDSFLYTKNKKVGISPFTPFINMLKGEGCEG